MRLWTERLSLTKRLSLPVRICLIAVGTVAAVVLAYFLRSPSALDFRLHRARYEGIVEKVKQEGPTRSTYVPYWVSRNLDPDSLTKDRPADGGVAVSAEWDDAGKCLITITTTDEGHFGYLGYIYSEGPPMPENYKTWPMGEGWWGFHDNNW